MDFWPDPESGIRPVLMSGCSWCAPLASRGQGAKKKKPPLDRSMGRLIYCPPLGGLAWVVVVYAVLLLSHAVLFPFVALITALFCFRS